MSSGYRLVRPKYIHLVTMETADDSLGGSSIPFLAFTNKRKAARYLKAANIKEQIEGQKIAGRSRYYALTSIRVL